jgi:hypothetical protein
LIRKVVGGLLMEVHNLIKMGAWSESLRNIYIYFGTLTSNERNAASEILAPIKECSKRPPSPRIGGDREKEEKDEHPRIYTSGNNAIGPPPKRTRNCRAPQVT